MIHPPDSNRLATPDRLRPRDGNLFVVRREASTKRRDVVHTYFRRRPDALAYAGRLYDQGHTVAVYRTKVTWEQIATTSTGTVA